MENRAYALIAGLFTLLLAAAGIAVATWFSGEHKAQTSYRLYTQYSVSGLNLQAPVRYRGVLVGKVVGVDFDPRNPAFIQIKVSVDSKTPISRATYAELGYQGITGLAYVGLEDDDTSPALRKEGLSVTEYIPVRPSLLDRVSASGEDLLVNVQELTQRAMALLSEKNQQQITHTLTSIQTASDRLAAVAGRAEPALEQISGMAQHAGVTLKRADTLFASLNRVTERVENDTLERVTRNSERLADSSEKLAAAGEKLGDAVANLTLPRVDSLMDELTHTSRNLDRLISNIDDQPQSLVFGKPSLPPGPGEPGFVAPARRAP